jgi:hypothetical protein
MLSGLPKNSTSKDQSRSLGTDIRSKSVGFRVTESDFASLQALAEEECRPLGEWCREIIFERVKGQQKSSSVLDQVILEELLALRMIVTSLLFDLTKGKMTPEQMEKLFTQVDAAKVKRAEEILGNAVKRYTG